MMDHVWSVLCTRAVIDERSHNLTLFNSVEQIAIKGVIEAEHTLNMPLEMVSFLTRKDINKPTKGILRISLISPSGKTIGTNEIEVNLMEAERNHSILSFNALPISEPGIYLFDIEIRGEEDSEMRKVTTVPLQIIFHPPDKTITDEDNE